MEQPVGLSRDATPRIVKRIVISAWYTRASDTGWLGEVGLNMDRREPSEILKVRAGQEGAEGYEGMFLSSAA